MDQVEIRTYPWCKRFKDLCINLSEEACTDYCQLGNDVFEHNSDFRHFIRCIQWSEVKFSNFSSQSSFLLSRLFTTVICCFFVITVCNSSWRACIVIVPLIGRPGSSNSCNGFKSGCCPGLRLSAFRSCSPDGPREILLPRAIVSCLQRFGWCIPWSGMLFWTQGSETASNRRLFHASSSRNNWH